MYAREILVIATIILCLCGCAVSSQQLRADPMETGSLHVDVPFDEVRANLISVFKSCYKLSIGAGFYYPEIYDTTPNQAVTVEGVLDGKARQVLISVDATKNPNGGTDITYYKGRLAIFVNYKKTIENWANGNDKGC